MSEILVAYHTKSGNTQAMAEAMAEGVAASGVGVAVKNIAQVDASELMEYAGFIFGSPTYYGTPAWQVKRLFDESVVLHGRLAGKVGAAFSSSGNVGGGNESTCLAILQMMLVHGMVTVGAAQGDHYGPVSVGAPDDKVIAQCKAHGERVGKVVLALAAANS